MALYRMDANLLSLDADDFDEVADEFMQTVMRKAIRAFLKACTAKIPVRTGFMRGSFKDMQAFFGNVASGGSAPDLNPTLAAIFGDKKIFKEREEAKDIKVSKAGKIARLKALRNERLKAFNRTKANLKAKGISTRRLRFEEFYYSGKGKKILKTPTSGTQFVTDPEQTLVRRGDSVVFTFVNSIAYYQVNDFGSRIPSAPWGSLEAGQTALVDSLNRGIRRFPAITELMGLFRIAVRDAQITQTKTRPNIRGVISSMVSRINGDPD